MATTWFGRPPHSSNRRLHPGLRHLSRLWVSPQSFTREPDRFSNVQLKRVANHESVAPQLLLILCEATNVFDRQLPNMGADYIARLTFDLRGETVVILHAGIVHGAISYRIFPDERFIEVAFCAVDSSLQSRGYGRFIMQYFKTVMQSIELYDVLTCADNDAVDYFRKQGFNDREVMMDPERYLGRLKEYSNVVLVHCHLSPVIDYLNFATKLDAVIRFVESKVGKHLFPPLFDRPTRLRQGPPGFLNVSLRDVIQLTGSGPMGEVERSKLVDYDGRMAELKTKLLRILRGLQGDPAIAEVFQTPVTEEVAPRYFETIVRPMDLQTIERKLTRFSDFYKRPSVFAADIKLMIDNCKAYNDSDTMFYRVALATSKKFAQLYQTEFPESVPGQWPR
jgi:histone acetyltransferase